MSNDLFARDLRAVLTGLAPPEVPASLRARLTSLEPGVRDGGLRRLAALLPQASDWLERLAQTARAAVAVLLVCAIGMIALYATRGADTAAPRAGPKAIVWRTNLASLEADGIAIETAGEVFRAEASNFQVTSDPGSDTYRTLEISWLEHDREMRLNLYFAADHTSWWVSELRVYDGRAQAEWITFPGPLFKSERGQSFAGDINLSGSNERGPGRLRIDGARLTAFVPGTGPRPFEDCRFIGPGRDPLGGPVLQESDPDLSEFGLVPGMSARDAYDRIVHHGICYEFRLEFPALNQDQRWCLPPPGNVREFLFGSSGELLVFVEDQARKTSDPTMPDFVGCQSTRRLGS